MASRAHLVAALALGLAVFGCKDAPTQLLVVVDSDLEVPAVLTDVEIIAEVTGRADVDSTFDVTGGPGSACTPTACPLPLTVGVAPVLGNAEDRAQIVVRALGPAGELVTRTVKTGFVKGRQLLVPVFLASNCRGVSCDPSSTCDRGACVPESVDPLTLDEVPEGFDPSLVFPPMGVDAATQVADAGVAVDADESRSDVSSPSSEDAEAAMDAAPVSDAGVARDVGSWPDAFIARPMLDWVPSTVSSVSHLEFTRTEVTVDQYSACVHAGTCATDTFATYELSPQCNTGYSDRGAHPMNCVNWFGAEAFCAWVGGQLPTQEEWIAEASNGDMRAYPWGDTPEASCTHAVIRENGNGCGQDRTWPVCSKSQGNSVSGLCDMSGNAAEWTQSMEDQGLGGPGRVVCGGAARSSRLAVRANSTFTVPPDARGWELGIRCVR